MNKKGFTLIELLAVLALLGIVVGITVYSIGNIFKNAKEKSEDAFVATLSDAAEMYLTSKEAKALSFSQCDNTLNKSLGNRSVYKSTVNFSEIMGIGKPNNDYKPLDKKDFVNPANEEGTCNVNALVNIYRDDDYVYYYSFEKTSIGCLTKSGTVTNLPKIDTNGDGVVSDGDGYYTCG